MRPDAREQREAERSGHTGPAPADVIFVAMPYAAVERPSLALATLSAALSREGILSRTIHANLRFAERIGPNHYDVINGSEITSQLGEWTFAKAAFGDEAPGSTDDFVGYLGAIGYPTADLPAWLETMRRAAETFVEDLADEIVAQRPRIVGCSSVFQQHCASLALLRAVARRDPDIITMLGGANCEGAMGVATHRSYAWVDVVVSGEADRLLPDLCRALLAEGRAIAASSLPYGVLGPAHRAGNAKVCGPAPRVLVSAMDELPVPDFDDYFDQLAASPLRRHIRPSLVVETSRGCWWGAKHHCTFCGLNGAGMTYRAKSEDRVERELMELSGRYGLKRFMTVDNILDHRYFRNVLPTLAERGDMLFFYETKANLTRRQLAVLSRAGVRWIQPGIEAMSDELLKLLDKGCSVAVNVQLLKWAYEYGIWVIWNHLYGAPGDDASWYDTTADWIPLIAHLQPPPTGMMVKVRYDRFSPYFNKAEFYGLRLKPYQGYELTYPSRADLDEQAYFFIDDKPQNAPPFRLIAAIRAWAEGFYGVSDASEGLPERRADAPILSMSDDGRTIFIRDTRPCATAPEHRLDMVASAVCRACDGARDSDAIREGLLEGGHSVDAVEAALQSLIAAGIVARFGTNYLCLATDAGAKPYPPFKDFAGGLFYRVQDRPAGSDADPWSMPVTELFTS